MTTSPMDLLSIIAKASQSPDSAKDSMTNDLVLRSRLSAWLTKCAQKCGSGKTSQDARQLTVGRISDPSSPRLMTSGILCRGLYLTQSFSEYRKGGVACLLADILEPTGKVQQKYFLSQRACAGILRRAEKRGKAIPPALKTALETVAFPERSAHPEQDSTGRAPAETS